MNKTLKQKLSNYSIDYSKLNIDLNSKSEINNLVEKIILLHETFKFKEIRGYVNSETVEIFLDKNYKLHGVINSVDGSMPMLIERRANIYFNFNPIKNGELDNDKLKNDIKELPEYLQC